VRPKLTLKKPPPPVPADPVKMAQSLVLGHRYVQRDGRYIQQMRVMVNFLAPTSPNELTWIDIPLVPETYGP
jgi:hypothetical protein